MTAAAHSTLGASSSHRWMACPGSVRLSAGVSDGGSRYAAEGSAAHALAEHCLTRNADAGEFVGEAFGGFDVDEDMAAAVQVYLDTVRGIIKSNPDAEYEFEQRFDLAELHPAFFGTSDAVIYVPAARELIVIDYKHGRGVPVEVADNPQLLYYALGSAMRYHNRGLSRVTIMIVQPRCAHSDGPVRLHTLDAVDLIEWSSDLVAAAKRTEAPDAPLVPGAEQCKFCPAAAVCPALRDMALKAAQAEFLAVGEEMTLPDPTTYSPDQLALTLREVDLVEDWCRRVRGFAHHEAEAGRCPPGFKLVATRPSRKWKDAEAVVETLADFGVSTADMHVEPKLKSPAQMEKLGKAVKSAIGELWEKVSGGTVVVPLSDAREPVKPEAQSEFSAVE